MRHISKELVRRYSLAAIGIGGLGHMALKFLNDWVCEVMSFTSSESKRTEALDLGDGNEL